jgi:hypothetical protein
MKGEKVMGYTTKLSDEQLEAGETSSPDNPVDDPEEGADKEKKTTKKTDSAKK